MWMEERTNNKGTRYTFYERYLNPDTGKMIRVSVTLNSNTKRAQKEAARLLLDKFQKRQEAAPTVKNHLKGLTFEAVSREWLEATEPTVKETTHKAHAAYARRIVERIPENLLFLDFMPATAEKIVTSMHYKENYVYGYVASVLQTIKAVMKYAKKAGYIQNITPFLDIVVKKRPATMEELEAKQNKFLNRDELKSALTQLNAKNPRVALAMEFLSLTGLRCGELTALRVQDFDAENKLVNVNGTMNYTVDRLQRGTPKNVYSFRSVSLNARAVDIVRWFILDNRKRAAWNPGKYHDNGYIFTANDGRPFSVVILDHVLKNVNLPGKNLTTHVFRHTHISMLCEMGLPLKTIMQRVGHNNPKTTLEIYTHVTENMKKELSEKLEALKI